MSPKTYRQYCPVARTLDVIGERWTLLLIRDLLAGPQSYSALLVGLPGLTTNLLAKRLRTLQSAELVEALEVDDKANLGSARGLYGLTAAGHALAPVLGALSEWGRQFAPAASPDATMNHRWLLLVLARHYRMTGARWLVQLDSEGHSFQFRLGTESFEAREGANWNPDLVIQATPKAFYAMFYGEAPVQELLADGRIELGGPPECRDEVWRDFQGAFGLGPANG